MMLALYDKKIVHNGTKDLNSYAGYLNGALVCQQPSYIDADKQLDAIIAQQRTYANTLLVRPSDNGNGVAVYGPDAPSATLTNPPTIDTTTLDNPPQNGVQQASAPLAQEPPPHVIVGYPGLLTGQEIEALGLVKPCVEKVSNGKLSYGLEGCGYTIRLAPVVYQSNPYVDPSEPFDPKRASRSDYLTLQIYTDDTDSFVLLPPRSFGLASSVEAVELPADVIGICENKSSYARSGIQWQITPLENGWRGDAITLEWYNSTHRWVRAYIGEGVMQIIFLRANQPPRQAYQGYYQDQASGITLPKVNK